MARNTDIKADSTIQIKSLLPDRSGIWLKILFTANGRLAREIANASIKRPEVDIIANRINKGRRTSTHHDDIKIVGNDHGLTPHSDSNFSTVTQSTLRP
jgi:hypothetical protein